MLRDYQRDHKAAIYNAWQTARNVLAVLPTGAGKTTVFSNILNELGAPACVVAHRQELVSQAALALNRDGVPHSVIAPKTVVQQIIRLEMETHGKSLYSSRAPIRVAGVDTLVARGVDAKDRWFQQVQTAVIDEAHHVLAANKWGAALAMFPNARGLLPTAHAMRADGAGLGRSADGLADAIVVGPSGRELINRGFLVDYRIITPPSDVDVSNVPIGSTGDYSAPKLAAAVHASKTIVGDVVRHYLKFAEGKLGLTFAVDIQAAAEFANAYRAAGIPAEVITAKTPISVRAQLMRKFRNRELLQLVSVDVLGEGTDVPAVEVVSMARHTMSFQLYAQMFGRMLRLMIPPDVMARWDDFTDEQRLAYIAASPKPRGILIDHVGNFIERHGPPDKPRVYSLDRRERKSRSAPDAIPLRTCLNDACLQPYERVLVACPHCGTPAPAPAGRGTPEMVDGDLVELDPAVLASLRGEIARVDAHPRIPKHLPPHAAKAVCTRHAERQAAQTTLRHNIALAGGYHALHGLQTREFQRWFYLTFGVDVMTAQTLGASDAQLLNLRVSQWLTAHNVVEI